MTKPRFARILAAVAASSALTFGLISPAAAAERTPAEVAGTTTLATLTPVAKGTLDVTTLNPDWSWNTEPKWIAATNDDPRVDQYLAYSPALEKDVPVAVIPATNEAGDRLDNAPTLYLLNGAGGAEQDNDWIVLAETVDFYSGKGVNVVIPMAGAFSYYMDWANQNPQGNYYLQGPQMWETFLTKELPGPIEEALNANNDRGVIGFSMSATSSLLMAEHNPGFYDAVGSFSGCAATSTPAAHFSHNMAAERGGVTFTDIVGAPGSDEARENDALVNAAGLRGSELYISNASGLAGREDQQSFLHEKAVEEFGMDYTQAMLAASINTLILQGEGGIIEAFTNKCTHDLKAKLDTEGIPAHFEFRNHGTHSWPYWRADLEDSWFVTFAPAFGLN
ncbi:MAG TPA: alpha/beta hydrolase family protein [Corynebacterium sp.]|nr:alpha/beta hydrolase family protein [Corynebacterium sp.]